METAGFRSAMPYHIECPNSPIPALPAFSLYPIYADGPVRVLSALRKSALDHALDDRAGTRFGIFIQPIRVAYDDGAAASDVAIRDQTLCFDSAIGVRLR